MNRTLLLLSAGLIGPAAFAQTQPGTPAGWEYRLVPDAQSLPAAGRGGRGIVAPLPRAEAGKPYSATVTAQTTQTLSDGTHVNQVTTTLEYRDSDGRVRKEATEPRGASGEPAKVITISDPVAGATYNLDPSRRTAIRTANQGGPVGVFRPVPDGRGGQAAGPSQQTVQELMSKLKEATATLAGGAGGAPEGGGRGARGRGAAQPAQTTTAVLRPVSRNPNETVEDLGTLMVNGVPATGTRITTKVPVGTIGNDREFQSVTERWFSAELNLLIKSVSTDPRFGTTTFERTNITRVSPDPMLFQVPAEYTILPR